MNAIKHVWSKEEDEILKNAIDNEGQVGWSKLSELLPGRNGKQCRDRWYNHLRPQLKKDDWTPEEDEILFKAQEELGNVWSRIAVEYLPGRTDLSVKNRFYSFKRKQARAQRRSAEDLLQLSRKRGRQDSDVVVPASAEQPSPKQQKMDAPNVEVPAFQPLPPMPIPMMPEPMLPALPMFSFPMDPQQQLAFALFQQMQSQMMFTGLNYPPAGPFFPMPIVEDTNFFQENQNQE